MATTDGSGNASFIVTFPTTVPTGQFITATATDPGDNTSEFSQCVEVVPKQADLAVTKIGSSNSVIAGEHLAYTLNVTNDGPARSTAVMVIDTLPAGVDFLSSTSASGPCAELGGMVTCNLGNLNVGAMATTTIVVLPTIGETS